MQILLGGGPRDRGGLKQKQGTRPILLVQVRWRSSCSDPVLRTLTSDLTSIIAHSHPAFPCNRAFGKLDIRRFTTHLRISRRGVFVSRTTPIDVGAPTHHIPQPPTRRAGLQRGEATCGHCNYLVILHQTWQGTEGLLSASSWSRFVLRNSRQLRFLG